MTTKQEFIVAQGKSTADERAAQQFLFKGVKSSVIPDSELLHNISIFMPRQHLARLLYCHHLYNLIREVFGDIFIMGVRWGFEMVAFNNLKVTLDPYAFDRSIVGFDTFEGFSSISKKDGSGELLVGGAYGVSPGYDVALSEIMSAHRDNAPRANLTKFELVKGDIMKTVDRYLEEKPQTVISLLYMDLDLYEPTKKCIESLYERIPIGGIICFDQLNHKLFPGETRALMDTLSLSKSRIRKAPWLPGRGYIVKGD